MLKQSRFDLLLLPCWNPVSCISSNCTVGLILPPLPGLLKRIFQSSWKTLNAPFPDLVSSCSEGLFIRHFCTLYFPFMFPLSTSLLPVSCITATKRSQTGHTLPASLKPTFQSSFSFKEKKVLPSLISDSSFYKTFNIHFYYHSCWSCDIMHIFSAREEYSTYSTASTRSWHTSSITILYGIWLIRLTLKKSVLTFISINIEDVIRD